MSRLITLPSALREKIQMVLNLKWFSTLLLSVKHIEKPSYKQTAHVMEEYGHKRRNAETGHD